MKANPTVKELRQHLWEHGLTWAWVASTYMARWLKGDRAEEHSLPRQDDLIGGGYPVWVGGYCFNFSFSQICNHFHWAVIYNGEYVALLRIRNSYDEAYTAGLVIKDEQLNRLASA